MPMLRKIVDEKDARTCLAAVARSGVTLKAWTKRHGVDGRSLHSWKRNLARRTSPPPGMKPKLVELVPVAQTSSLTRRYVVRVGDASIEVGDDFDAGTLRRLVEVLRTC
jgi:transposase-like protein